MGEQQAGHALYIYRRIDAGHRIFYLGKCSIFSRGIQKRSRLCFTSLRFCNLVITNTLAKVRQIPHTALISRRFLRRQIKKFSFFYSMYILGYLNITAPQNHPTRFKSKKKLEFICWLFRSPYLCSVLIKQLIV